MKRYPNMLKQIMSCNLDGLLAKDNIVESLCTAL